MGKGCIFCKEKNELKYEVLVCTNIIGDFCSVPCVLGFCKYTLGLFGLEQVYTWMKSQYDINIRDYPISIPRHKYIPYELKLHDLPEERSDREQLTRRESIYEKFLESKIGHSVSNDFFSLDSLIKY